MTCRHQPGDPNCSSHPRHAELLARTRGDATLDGLRKGLPDTPDAANYEIIDVIRVGPHLVLKVRYPNCERCSYEGVKVLVFLNANEADALRWRVIDPHFRDPKGEKTRKVTEAPGPNARFPGSTDGWSDAVAYARSKVPAAKREP